MNALAMLDSVLTAYITTSVDTISLAGNLHGYALHPDGSLHFTLNAPPNFAGTPRLMHYRFAADAGLAKTILDNWGAAVRVLIPAGGTTFERPILSLIVE